MKITNFSCFKNKKEKDTHPDYKLSAKIGDEYVEIGAGWIKKGNSGAEFISFKLKDPYEARNSYHIEEDLAPKQAVKPETKPTVVIEYPNEEVNPDDIPF